LLLTSPGIVAAQVVVRSVSRNGAASVAGRHTHKQRLAKIFCSGLNTYSLWRPVESQRKCLFK
jgi:hypothetical protein